MEASVVEAAPPAEEKQMHDNLVEQTLVEQREQRVSEPSLVHMSSMEQKMHVNPVEQILVEQREQRVSEVTLLPISSMEQRQTDMDQALGEVATPVAELPCEATPVEAAGDAKGAQGGAAKLPLEEETPLAAAGGDVGAAQEDAAEPPVEEATPPPTAAGAQEDAAEASPATAVATEAAAGDDYPSKPVDAAATTEPASADTAPMSSGDAVGAGLPPSDAEPLAIMAVDASAGAGAGDARSVDCTRSAWDFADSPDAQDEQDQGVLAIPDQQPQGQVGVVARIASTAQRVQQQSEQFSTAVSDRCSCSLWDSLGRLPGLYCQKLGQHSWAFALFYSLVVVIVVSAFWREVLVNSSIDNFYKADGDASMRHDVYLEAQNSMRQSKSATSISDRTTFDLYLYYRAKDDSIADGRVLSEAALHDVRHFERDLLSSPDWISMCNRSEASVQFRCQPGETLGNFVWPTRKDLFLDASGEFGLSFNGEAKERLPLAAVLAYLGGGSRNLGTFLPQDGSDLDSKELRSHFTFTAPSLDDTAFREQYEAFVSTWLYPKLMTGIKSSREENEADKWKDEIAVTLFFSGDVVDDYDIRLALYKDVKKAAGCLVLVFLFAWVHLRSAFLAFFGTWLLCMAPLLSFVSLPTVERLGLATFLGVFIVMGLGGNTLYYTASEWERSREIFGQEARLTRRLLQTYKDVFFQLLPVGMSAAGFFMLFLSLLKPLREMGLFAGVCMLYTCLLCLLIFVPLLVLHERMVRPFVQGKLPRWASIPLEPAVLQIPWDRLAQACMKVASRGKWLVIGGVAVTLLLLCITLAVAAGADDTGLPELFPPSHHRAARREVMNMFGSVVQAETPLPPEVTFCEPQRNAECGLHWCEAPEHSRHAHASTCQCWATALPAPPCSAVDVSARFSGASELHVDDLKESLDSDLKTRLNNGLRQVANSSWADDGVRALPSLVLEHWESGKIDVEPLLGLPSLRLDLATAASARMNHTSCPMELVCHCGHRACNPPSTRGFQTNMSLQLVTSRRLSEVPSDERAGGEADGADAGAMKGRRTSELDVAASPEVTVVFGITPPDSSDFLDATPTWSFDDSFDAAAPAAQRAMLAMCTDPALQRDLDVESVSCWIDDFKEWVKARGEQFPVCRFCNFTTQVGDFMTANPAAAQSMWLDDSGNVIATAFSFKTKPKSTAEEILQGQTKWIEYVSSKNEGAESTASQAWITSQTWVDAEAYDEALASSWRVALCTMLLLALAGLAYTLDIRMMCAIVLLTFCCAVLLSFLMYCIFQWHFGPWELVITTLFTCYSLEPALRITCGFLGRGTSNSGPLKGAAAPLALPAPAPAQSSADGSGAASGTAAPVADEAQAGPSQEQDKRPVDPMGSASSLEPQGAGGSSMAGEDAWPPGSQETAAPPRQAAAAPSAPEADGAAARLGAAVRLIIADTVMVAVKLFVCGMFLASCDLRLFSRLGVLSIWLPILWLPAMLVFLPAVVLYSGRTSMEPDCVGLWRRCSQCMSDGDS